MSGGQKNVGHCLIRLSQIATGKIFDVVIILLFMLYWLFSYRMLDVLFYRNLSLLEF